MSSKRVLLICYYFPPMGGAGVGRPLALYKNLPGLGIECDVLTVKSVAYRLYEPELLHGLDVSRIYRAGSRDPQRLMYLIGLRKVKDSTISRGKRVSDRFFPDPKVGWVPSAVKLGRVLVENRKYQCLLSTSPPMSAHLVAKKLSGEFGLPWVADFRDFWTGYKAETWFDSERKVARARKLMEEIKGTAAKVTVVNPAIAEYLGAGQVIYNSFDENRAQRWGQPLQQDHFIIGVLGTLDDLRPIEPLFEVMAMIRDVAPDVFDRIRLLQVGTVNSGDVNSLIDRYGLKGKCDLRGLVKRERSVEILSASSMLYIGLASPDGKGVLPGRIFDMLASGRPILAVAPSGSEVERLIGSTGAGGCFGEDELDRAAAYVMERVRDQNKAEQVQNSAPSYADSFRSSEMARKFAEVIDSVT